MTQLQTDSDSLDSDSRTTRQTRWLVMVVAAIVVAMFFFELGDSKTFSSHESYTVVPVREMLDSGDWIVPRHGGVPRLEKPPLNYWLTAATAILFGEISEWTARIPAAVSGVLLAGLIGLWGARWFGRTVGFAAALAQAMSVHSVVYGRKAEVDMLLCLFIVAALFLIAQQPSGQPFRQGLVRWFGVYVLLGLAWLCKFYYGAVMVLVPTVVFFIIQKRYADLRHLFNPFGWAFLAACACIWPSLVLARIPEAAELWMSETVGRATGAQNFDRQPVWYYLPQIFTLGFPAVAFAAYRMRESWAAAWKQGDPRERFLWVWLLSHLAIVSVSPNKHPNYILPALPVLSLSGGLVITRLIQLGRAGKIRLPGWASVPTTITVIGIVAVTYLILSNKWPHLTEPLICISVLLGLSCVVVFMLIGTRRPLTAGCVAVAAYLMCYFLVIGWIVPGRDYRRPSAQFARHIRGNFPEQPICVFGMGKTPVVFYLDTPVFRFESTDQLADRLSHHRELLVVTSERHVTMIDRIAACQVVRRLQYDQANNSRPDSKLVLLRLAGNGETDTAAKSPTTNLR